MSATGRSPTPSEPRPFAVQLKEATAILCAVVALLVITAVTIHHWVNRPPFRLILDPADDHAVVQFVQPGRHQVSAPIVVPLHLDRRHEIVLDGDTVAIPGGSIEFADTTMLPGDFKIRFGETRIHVMPLSIVVDGKRFEWRDDEAPATQAER